MAKPRRVETLHQRALALLNMLAVQFVLGMIVNLFVTLSKKHPGSTNGNYFTRSGHSFGWAITFGGGVAVFLHVVVALGLLFGSIIFVARSARARDRSWLVIAIVGLLGIVTAFSNGLAFLDYDKNANSFVMAMGFIVAVVAYTVGVARPALSALGGSTSSPS